MSDGHSVVMDGMERRKKRWKSYITVYIHSLSFLFFFQTFCVCFIPQKNSRENTRDWKSREYYVGLHSIQPTNDVRGKPDQQRIEPS